MTLIMKKNKIILILHFILIIISILNILYIFFQIKDKKVKVQAVVVVRLRVLYYECVL